MDQDLLAKGLMAKSLMAQGLMATTLHPCRASATIGPSFAEPSTPCAPP
jgi:hypothetical protein